MTSISFFSQRSTAVIAQDLLGRKLTYASSEGIVGGYIVETEAYLGEEDSTAHAFKGRRSSFNEALYGPPGTIYIYTLRGLYLFNLVAQEKDVPQGILIRAVEPCCGRNLMERHRPKSGFELTNGPAKFMEAWGIRDKKLNGTLIGTGPLSLTLRQRRQPQQIIAGPRIGVSQRGTATFAPLRFYVAGNPYVSNLRKREMQLTDYGWKK
ncbi:DNA-3-methyladenine glycosylase [Liquorilactobacillus satsumensis]|uniref:DNA-3-methyladenine glycosylase n=1 Tax=Liquorilactobacillus satsumensis TaxID=259059 RepID=UPI0021C34F20|nr:DNA-3-methyladenine glycosylase [Liquorilactobacillus satsumensis]MCP9312013.1 DNA-3-methyladenine glycosylase [Liquorilactobacillus satsumensis]MCP9359147.1 DNA-3-methyladenine glycosylase [Liquorilactobacillus satsumensis]